MKEAFDLPVPSIHCESGVRIEGFPLKCGDQKAAQRLRRLEDVNSSRADDSYAFLRRSLSGRTYING